MWGLPTSLLCSEQLLHLHTLAGLCLHVPGTVGPLQICCMAVITLVSPSPHLGHCPGGKPGRKLPGPANCLWDITRRGGPAQGPAWGTGSWTGAARGLFWELSWGSAGSMLGLSWGLKLGGCTGGAQGHVGRLYWWSARPRCCAPGTVVWAALGTEVTPLLLGKEKRRPWAQLLPSSGGS